MSDTDLTDYVDVAAQAYIAAYSALDWDKLPEASTTGQVSKFSVRELVLPIVTAVIDAYVEAHPALDLDWLEG